MKNLRKFAAIALGALALTTFNSCDDSDSNGESRNIAEVATETPELSILVQALTRAGLVDDVSGNTKLTVFAPTNQAFLDFLQANDFPNLEAVPVDVLREVLRNHVLVGSLRSNQLETGYYKTLATGAASTTSTISMFVNANNGVVLNGGVTNGGATVTTANVRAKNGTIHIVNSVIGIPDVVDLVLANPNYSSLRSALTRNDQPDFVTLLRTQVGTAPAPVTVFAPDNDAFAALLGELNAPNLAAINGATLTAVLNYHVVGGANVLAGSLQNNQTVTTAGGGTFTIQLPTSGAQITDGDNRVTKITATDIQGNNGVIHQIDRVLLP
ncbi:fasciclin domain-containing protein [Flavobacterium sp.]|uniref:fasciclin domain-containing protein n=1 Tax=Flavobacterium sp. TaxID=239 RepID=UPI0026235BB8|nr:fasciclin domain-containing protein [Flavobacterium sp.]